MVAERCKTKITNKIHHSKRSLRSHTYKNKSTKWKLLTLSLSAFELPDKGRALWPSSGRACSWQYVLAGQDIGPLLPFSRDGQDGHSSITALTTGQVTDTLDRVTSGQRGSDKRASASLVPYFRFLQRASPHVPGVGIGAFPRQREASALACH